MTIRPGEVKFFPIRDVEELIWVELDYPDLVRMSRVNRACYHQLRKKHLQGHIYVQWYVKAFERSSSFLEEFKWMILRECSLRTIDWLTREMGFSYGQHHLDHLCRYGRLDLIQRLDFRFQISQEDFFSALESGNVTLAEYLLCQNPTLAEACPPEKVIQNLMSRESLGMLQFLISLDPRVAWLLDSTLWMNAIYNLNFPMIRWLIATVPRPVDLTDGFKHAIYTDQLPLAQLLFRHSSPMPPTVFPYLLDRVKTSAIRAYLQELCK